MVASERTPRLAECARRLCYNGDMSDVTAALSRELGLPPAQVARVSALFDEGNTIPFLARYRKEQTGGLDEVGLRALEDALGRARKLEERRREVQASLTEQGVLTPELAARLAAADKLAVIEDLYLPFRPKRRTRASQARDRGLAPLAAMFARPPRESPLEAAKKFLGAEVPTVEAALAGARDILAEQTSEDPEVRGRARALSMKEAVFTATKAPKGEDPQGKFAQYYAFKEPVVRVQPHRVLACDRGESEGVLRIGVDLPEARILGFMRDAVRVQAPGWREEADAALTDGLARLLGPAIERDVRGALTEKAQAHAIAVFAANVKALLLQPPLKGKVVMGIDPGFRTGCKVVVVDKTGAPLGTGLVIYPHEPQKQYDQALKTLRDLIARHSVDILAIGNGTASRETEMLAAEAIKGTPAAYVIVSEAGASVYSASDVAREEFPDLDATQRGNISIARRLQDPLAELVKIDPQAIGVGLYQHDLDQKALARSLAGVVEDAVNHVGVDLNTASASLLTHVAGLTKKTAQAIVAQRQAQGGFRRRDELKAVKGLGDRTFVQAAGFLRISGGADPLDNTAIHPESYPATRKLLARLGLDPAAPGLGAAVKAQRAGLDPAALAAELGLGVPTLTDILESLEKPGRDPREALPQPHLRQDVLKLDDLKPGMRLTGTVRNVVDFGAFVDVGLKNDGLVHVSELSDRFVRNPMEVVAVGDVIEVEVLEFDAKRGRVSLSRKRALAPKA
ncbi:MAG: Transcription accessory protein RNA-binding domain [Cyanobacteria bacterium RYN_339]|nr:Transcription accessory protein RNA-binding domain [Cyanobacteria bacterium RYN_339]